MSDREEVLSQLAGIQTRIAAAAARAGRNPEDITLVAVSKTFSAERIMPCLEAGILNLGENRVQELQQKMADPQLEKACWHQIGYLQTNKVKYLIGRISLIHSVDRLELAEEISRRSVMAGVVTDCLLQVNVSGEETKSGVAPEEVHGIIDELSKYKGIRIRGLMTMAPFVGDESQIRACFKGLREIFLDIKGREHDNIGMEFLSMGMSNDFEIAIEEGANLIRVGTAIFGKR